MTRNFFPVLLVTVALLMGCDSAVGPDDDGGTKTPPTTGPFPVISLLNSDIVRNFTYDGKKDITLELSVAIDGGVESVEIENAGGVRRQMKYTGRASEYVLNIGNLTEDDTKQTVVVNGVKSFVDVDLDITFKDVYIAVDGNALIQFTEDGYSYVKTFSSDIESISKTKGGFIYVVDTKTSLHKIRYDGTPLYWEFFDGTQAKLIGDDFIAFNRWFEDTQNIFMRELSGGSERQITHSDCIDNNSIGWCGFEAPVAYKNLIVVSLFSQGMGHGSRVSFGTVDPITSEVRRLGDEPLNSACWTHSSSDEWNFIGLSCFDSITNATFAAVFEVNNGVLHRFPDGTHSPSFLKNGSVILVNKGVAEITDLEGNMSKRFPSFQGVHLTRPQPAS